MFKGNPYIIIDFDGKEGAITTPELYKNFDTSYAHLFSNGNVCRYGQVIGTIDDDIIFIGEEDKSEIENFSGFTSPAWNREV